MSCAYSTATERKSHKKVNKVLTFLRLILAVERVLDPMYIKLLGNDI